jgi:hypothetical protein
MPTMSVGDHVAAAVTEYGDSVAWTATPLDRARASRVPSTVPET